MLQIKNVTKNYIAQSATVTALRNISIGFGNNGFVSILGPSGCGKSTLLNIIGGLDMPTSGHLFVDSISSDNYTENDWNAYRNSSIGFIFQNYNLINHLSVLENVEMTLKLSGFNKSQFTQLALEALKKVHMEEHASKKPTELSGGQIQRVSIARAIVNNPRIILADEPTGALDSESGEQIIGVLKEISSERLVIMVTHNTELALKYSTRTIQMKDGQIVSDSLPYKEQFIEEKLHNDKVNNKTRKLSKIKRTTIYLDKLTALKLSLKNLITKKRRTMLTSVAGSVGIIGLGLVLAFSNGITLFMENMQNSLLASIPIGIYEYSMDYSVLMDVFMSMEEKEIDKEDFPNNDIVNLVPANEGSGIMGDLVEEIIDSVKENDITEEFIDYMDKMDESWYDALYSYSGIQMNIISKNDDGDFIDISPEEIKTNVVNIATNVLGEKGLEKSRWNQLVGDNKFMSQYYDLMSGEWPKDKGDLVVVVNERNELEIPSLTQFGIEINRLDLNKDGIVSFDELLSKNSGYEVKLITNDAFYEKTGEHHSVVSGITIFDKKTPNEEMYDSEGSLTLKIVGVLRVKSDSPIRAVGANLCYTKELADYAYQTAINSEITKEQQKLLSLSNYTKNDSSAYTVLKNKTKVTDKYVNSSIIGLMSASLDKTAFLKSIGVDSAPVYINIYATDLDGKEKITNYIDSWNIGFGGKVSYFDVSEMFMYNVGIITDISVYALLIVASISLIVSSIMIGIITSNSVVERTREIGILRSMGARKSDIVRIFLSETIIIGACSGLIGVALTYAITPLLSLLAKLFCGIPDLAIVNPFYSIGLFILSIVLAVISGLIPSIKASKKNVVDALRVE